MAKLGVDDLLEDELKALRRADTALFNAVHQHDHLESWEESLWAVSELEEAAERLRDRIRDEVRKRDV